MRPSEIGREFSGLPMPRKIEILTDQTRRPQQMTGHKRFPFPVPNGWFVVARADELAPRRCDAAVLLRPRSRALPHRKRSRRACSTRTARTSAPTSASAAGSTASRSAARSTAGVTPGASGTCVEVPYDEVDFIPKTAHARVVPDDRAQPDDLGLASPRGRAAHVRRAGGRGDRRPGVVRHRRARVPDRHLLLRR